MITGADSDIECSCVARTTRRREDVPRARARIDYVPGPSASPSPPIKPSTGTTRCRPRKLRCTPPSLSGTTLPAALETQPPSTVYIWRAGEHVWCGADAPNNNIDASPNYICSCTLRASSLRSASAWSGQRPPHFSPSTTRKLASQRRTAVPRVVVVGLPPPSYRRPPLSPPWQYARPPFLLPSLLSSQLGLLPSQRHV